MGKTTIGKLKEMLILETKQNGEPTIVVIPKGCIVEVSSEDEYTHMTTKKDIKDAVKYLTDYE